MFQKLNEEVENEKQEDINETEGLDKKSIILKRAKEIFSIQNIVIYIIAFMVGKVSFGGNIAPFGLAFLAASLSNHIPLLPVWILAGISTLLGFGKEIALEYLLTSLLFIGFILISKTKFTENGKAKLGFKLFICTIVVQVISMFFKEFLIYDLLTSIFLSLCICIFYKIFSNSLEVLKSYEKAFSPEEIVGASLLVTIALASLGSLGVFGFSIRNILSILLVLILGWKNGILVGGTSGITIGVVLAIIGIGDMSTIASFAFSGMIAGLLSRFGKIGVVIGFFVGNAILTYISTGYAISIIYFREIFIASLGLLLLPKRVEVNLEDIFGKDEKFEEPKIKQIAAGNEETISKINIVSEAISEMAETFQEAAVSTVEIEDLNLHTNNYIKDLRNTIATNDELLLKDIFEDDKIIISVYKVLEEEEQISVEQFLEILEANDQYIIQTDQTIDELANLVDVMNDTFKISKVNYIYEKKIENNKEAMAKQLNDVSKILENLAIDIETKNTSAISTEKAKYTLQIGISKTTKNNSIISGDSYITTMVQNNKMLLALSDGMGSGEKAKDKSEKVLKMLEKLLNSGIEKKDAIRVLNNSFTVTDEDGIFATLDCCIIDLESGISECIKLSGCPTYLKKENKIEVVKTNNLPVGIISDIEIEVHKKTLKAGDTFVMCTDGAIDYNTEYENKELWVKELLGKLRTDNPQKIADLILSEALDNGFGVARDDITVLVAKVLKTDGQLKII